MYINVKNKGKKGGSLPFFLAVSSFLKSWTVSLDTDPWPYDPMCNNVYFRLKIRKYAIKSYNNNYHKPPPPYIRLTNVKFSFQTLTSPTAIFFDIETIWNLKEFITFYLLFREENSISNC